MGDLKNEFAWSLSRHALFSECPRKFHFRHHAFWGGWNRGADPLTREIYRLTKLEHRSTWMGRAVHEAIARALARLRAGDPVRSPEDFADDVVERMREDFRDSVSDAARRTGDFKRHLRLFEHEAGLDDGSEAWRARWKSAADDVRAALAAFFALPLHLETLARLPPGDWIEVEDPLASFAPSFVLDGVKVHVKLDCAFRSGGRAVVVDWKAGRGPSRLAPVQLAAYALYLEARHGAEPGSVRALEVRLLGAEVVEHDAGEAALARFRQVFHESVARMRALLLDPAANVARPAADFPFTQDPKACERCEFRSVCPKVSPAY